MVRRQWGLRMKYESGTPRNGRPLACLILVGHQADNLPGVYWRIGFAR